MSPAARRACALALCTCLLLLPARPALAYLKFGLVVGNQAVTLKWKVPVHYSVTDAGVPGVTARDFQAAVARAFKTWQDVPTASISYVFDAFTARVPGEEDGRSTLGFRHEPGEEHVLASTSFLVDDITGELLESDIYFNSAFAWSTSAQGSATRWDVETIAVHEIGHLSGLGHSAIGETTETGSGRRVLSAGAVMFPIALGSGDITGRALDQDDIAGISDIYPVPGFVDETGSISGVVTKNERGVFGAHVVAFNAASGAMVSNFTLTADGQFSIAGLTPGPYVVRVEPLDDADIESFFDPGDPVDINFRVTYHDRLAIVPRGGDSGTLRVQVRSK